MHSTLKIVTFLVTQFYTASFHILPLGSKYFPQYLDTLSLYSSHQDWKWRYTCTNAADLVPEILTIWFPVSKAFSNLLGRQT